jgi:hypothetical protein
MYVKFLRGSREMAAIRALMAGLVDYAGLFPPASLDMVGAVRRYGEYLVGEDRWALGKFIVPATRLAEFSATFQEVRHGEHKPAWSLSVLATGDAAADAASMEAVDLDAVTIDAVEMKAASTEQAERLLRDFGLCVPVYLEFTPDMAGDFLPVLARFGARAKIRTGGITAQAFPAAEVVAEFLLKCARAKVAFKATAGLHHAMRGAYKLTYEPDCAKATMHGFVHVFLAAVLAWRGADATALIDTLTQADASAFAFGKNGVRWLGFDASADEIELTRRSFAVSYGSCSFMEPVEEAKALGWL